MTFAEPSFDTELDVELDLELDVEGFKPISFDEAQFRKNFV